MRLAQAGIGLNGAPQRSVCCDRRKKLSGRRQRTSVPPRCRFNHNILVLCISLHIHCSLVYISDIRKQLKAAQHFRLHPILARIQQKQTELWDWVPLHSTRIGCTQRSAGLVLHRLRQTCSSPLTCRLPRGRQVISRIAQAVPTCLRQVISRISKELRYFVFINCEKEKIHRD